MVNNSSYLLISDTFGDACGMVMGDAVTSLSATVLVAVGNASVGNTVGHYEYIEARSCREVSAAASEGAA